ncbi:DNA primase TraC [Oligella sp. MSHR50489EDL]|uniref:ArdC family protein n=1 Tax=Oligella sp. MSHR50489EDL TaxID=3139409 RepID=UPI003D814187
MTAYKKSGAERPDPIKEFADDLIKLLEENKAPWQRPWDTSMVAPPYNASTGKAYRGINNLSLMKRQFVDPRWLTFNQAKEMGCFVKKGEKAAKVIFYATTKTVDVLDEDGKPKRDEEGKKIKVTEPLDKPVLQVHHVFNAEQIEGLPPLELKKLNEHTVNERAAAILEASGANITIKASRQAYYRPSTDEIVLPLEGQFKTPEHFYSTALHELGHWTGHESRLNRDINNAYGTKEYAKEELRAEISSMMISQEIGIRHDPSNHVAYVKGWIQLLKDDPKEILNASRDAQKIFDYVMQFDREYTMKNTVEAKAADRTYIKPVEKNAEKELVI